MNSSQAEKDRLNREELVTALADIAVEDGIKLPIEGVRITRASSPTERLYGVARPSMCVIAQGAKEVCLADSRYRYDSEHYLLATVELPTTGRIVEANKSTPYLALRLELEPALIGSVMIESGLAAPQGQSEGKAVIVSGFEGELLDAIVRFVKLIGNPLDGRTLLPLVKREIVYRLLIGEQGSRLRHVPMLGYQSDRISQAIDRLRKEFNRPLRIDSLAKEFGMSSSGFHHHFKAVTDMSPLQFQKQLRLQEARQLMLSQDLDAATAGFKVGYEDASHFSRDYKKLFGDSPMRDLGRLRSMAIAD